MEKLLLAITSVIVVVAAAVVVVFTSPIKVFLTVVCLWTRFDGKCRSLIDRRTEKCSLSNERQTSGERRRNNDASDGHCRRR